MGLIFIIKDGYTDHRAEDFALRDGIFTVLRLPATSERNSNLTFRLTSASNPRMADEGLASNAAASCASDAPANLMARSFLSTHPPARPFSGCSPRSQFSTSASYRYRAAHIYGTPQYNPVRHYRKPKVRRPRHRIQIGVNKNNYRLLTEFHMRTKLLSLAQYGAEYAPGRDRTG